MLKSTVHRSLRCAQGIPTEVCLRSTLLGISCGTTKHQELPTMFLGYPWYATTSDQFEKNLASQLKSQAATGIGH